MDYKNSKFDKKSQKFKNEIKKVEIFHFSRNPFKRTSKKIKSSI